MRTILIASILVLSKVLNTFKKLFNFSVFIALTLIETNVYAEKTFTCYPTSPTTEVCREDTFPTYSEPEYSEPKESTKSNSMPLSGCPSGYRVIDEYHIGELKVRFKDEGKFNKCVNPSRPDLHNAKDNWGIIRGSWQALTCGNIFIKNTFSESEILVKSSIGYVYFKQMNSQDAKRRSFMKNNKYYQETSRTVTYWNKEFRKTIEYNLMNRDIFECKEVTF